MTLVVRMPVPDAARRTAIWNQVLDREALVLPAGTAEMLATRWPVSAGIAASSARAARLVDGSLPELEIALAGWRTRSAWLRRARCRPPRSIRS